MRSIPDDTGRGPSFIEAARRAQIIRAAITTVNEVGYHGASLSQIARRAGISKSIISYHFDGKEHLLLQLVEDVFDRLGAQLEAAVGAAETPVEQLSAYVRTYLGHIAAHREEMIAAVEVLVSHRTADGIPLYLKENESDTALLRGIIAAGIESGEFRAVDLEVATTTVEHALDGGLTRAQMDARTDPVAWGEHLLPMLLAALRSADV